MPRVTEVTVHYEDGSEGFVDGAFAQVAVDSFLKSWLKLRDMSHIFNCPECLHTVQVDEHGACPHNRRA